MRYICRLISLGLALLFWLKAAFPVEPNWPETLTLGTASPGGTYFTYGEGLAKILSRELGFRSPRGPLRAPFKTLPSWRMARSNWLL
jgi:TRAP-type uncharacterized transport system substrate-binding protein